MAVSIPIFTAQLRKAKVATDQANARAGKAAALEEQSESGLTYYYDAKSGKVQKDTKTGIDAYGKTSDAKGTDKIEGVTGETAVVVLVALLVLGAEQPYLIASLSSIVMIHVVATLFPIVTSLIAVLVVQDEGSFVSVPGVLDSVTVAAVTS